jgi:hypothetical protein
LTPRSAKDDIRNLIDYLLEAKLAMYANEVSLKEWLDTRSGNKCTRVAWHAPESEAQFLLSRSHATVDQYLSWVNNGQYSAVLFDASLLQISYDFIGNQVSAHRLAYIPCPFLLDRELLEEGHGIADIVELYTKAGDVALKSPVRFDYDPHAAKENHPAVHMTVNSPDCRIACVAPLHVHRFANFVFRSFYEDYWFAHSDYFAETSTRHIGKRTINDLDSAGMHVMWKIA